MANNLKINWLSPALTTAKSGLSQMNIAKIICFGLPASLIVGAYAHMALQYDKIWLFNTIVHENGKYTLLKVIFYFRHFIWEIPIKTWYAVVMAGLFFFYGKPQSNSSIYAENENYNHLIVISMIVAIGTAIIAICFTWEKFGLLETLTGLFQYRTSEVRPIAFGSHWRNHLLSNIVLLTSSTAAVLVYRMWIFKNWTRRRYGIVFPLAIALFIGITLMFGINSDPFNKSSYLGHQLREIFGTDLSITMLLSMGVIITLEEKYDKTLGHDIVINKKGIRNGLINVGILTSVAILVSLFLVISVLNLDISGEISKIAHGKKMSKLDLFAWHFFEHSLDYIYVTALVAASYLLLLKFDKKCLIRRS